MSKKPHARLPTRFERPAAGSLLAFLAFVAFLAWSFSAAGVSVSELVTGLPNMAKIASEMVPPATDRIVPTMRSVLVTFQMALVGTVIGILISLPLAVLMSRNYAPHPAVRSVIRSLVSFIRTIPDLAWALFFVASVGLGPFAGTLTLIMDTIGFCARFFAESIEEVDDGPPEALSAIGASRLSVIVCATLPMAMPSLINSSLFALEKAVRSSVVLGLVGAGGIGAELATSMELFRFDQAATIVLMIFLLVLSVEKISSRARTSLLKKRQ
ncbi:phosphonate ABC transporter, permease protein PhnE [Stutzerimonas kirkiae]|uniref:Phosphonate ABC transporter, permease protein PhnE n=1 Tax=Stutzerimonas kirkiae TaxID=2211392 RepID=A0A4Q9RG18_9GAMM|nr:phosphonate ABC transporter, permease protein PhnE [Stutzerimonas kirkiae]TBU99992.1 phosphonate ABC transporter, permease protein PhnE [Stutzerimonas kirkiae]TBV05698.1 phosphonate ABC transporter, permease protein PhnE [Stutzerimonas kirkiae]